MHNSETTNAATPKYHNPNDSRIQYVVVMGIPRGDIHQARAAHPRNDYHDLKEFHVMDSSQVMIHIFKAIQNALANLSICINYVIRTGTVDWISLVEWN